MKTTAGLAALALIAGCGQDVSVPTGPTTLNLSAEALHPVASPLVISMGRDAPGVVQAVARVLGAPPNERSLCPDNTVVERVRWGMGLTLYFIENDLRGWAASGTGFATTDGRVIGGPAAGSGRGVSVETYGGVTRVMRAGRNCMTG